MTEPSNDTPAAPATVAHTRMDVESHAPGVRAGGILQVAGGVRAIVPYANYALARLGRLGVVGLALLVFGAVTVLSTNAPLREQLASDNAALEQLTIEPGATTQAAASPQIQLEQFLNQLPTRDQLPSVMNLIVAASVAKGVELEQGKYELVLGTKNGEMAHYRMSFPVVGSYPQVRGFVDAALTAVPAMSLDGLRLQRRSIGDGVVTANIDFAVFVRTTP